VISSALLRERFTLLLLAFLFLASVYRARYLSISMDEAYTYLSFVAPPLSRVLTTYSPNHHVLYSLLAKASVQALGASEFSLRIPALLGSLLCLAAIRQMSRALFGTGWMTLLSICLVALNPLIFDYMSQARGYGLALGFYLFGVLFAVQALLLTPIHKGLRLGAAGFALGLSLAANIAFGIPVVALNLLILVADARSARGASGKAAARWITAARLVVPEIAVFGVIAAAPLIHADRRAFVGGFTSVFQTLDNFAVSCVLHDWDGNGLWTNQVNFWTSGWLFPAFRIAVLLVLGAVVFLFALRRWRRTPDDLWLFVFGGSLVSTVIMLIVAHLAAGAPYPFARIVMYCWPLLAFTICLLIEKFRRGKMPGRIFSALLLVFCLIMTAQSAVQFDLDHFGWLQYSAGTKQVADFIRRREPKAGKQLKISTRPSLYACLDFYRAVYSMPQWRLSVLSNSTPANDYIVMDVFDAPRGAPPGYRRIWLDPLSKAIIAVPDVASQPIPRDSPTQ
jgi:hypothetical protein